MRPRLFARSVVSLACVSLVVLPLPARADETIRCDSRGLGYNYCRVDTGGHVELVRQHSLFGCHETRSWGYDRHGVWVDRGCSADFRVSSSGHKKALVAGAALVGLAALLAMSSNRSQQAQAQAPEEVASWAVGTFSGYDETEGTEVQVTILPGGSVSGHAGSTSFTGSFKQARLQAGRHAFTVARSGNGFTATDERDPGHRVQFQRSGSGY